MRMTERLIIWCLRRLEKARERQTRFRLRAFFSELKFPERAELLFENHSGIPCAVICYRDPDPCTEFRESVIMLSSFR